MCNNIKIVPADQRFDFYQIVIMSFVKYFVWHLFYTGFKKWIQKCNTTNVLHLAVYYIIVVLVEYPVH